MPTIKVVGSLNVDMVTITPRMPEGGETLKATSFQVGWGGKGANQAVAAARLSRKKEFPKESEMKISMHGAVGADVFGPQIKKSLEADGIDVAKIRVLEGEATGTAVILVEEASGENRILFTPGANFSANALMKLDAAEADCDVAIFQLETPMDVVAHNLRVFTENGASTIVNPAPAQRLPESMYADIDYLILNESEAAILSGRPAGSISSASDLDAIAVEFMEKQVDNVIITLGGEGVYYHTRLRWKGDGVNSGGQGGQRLPAVKTEVVDTTAAGDTFVGAFAVRLARSVAGSPSGIQEDDMKAAVSFANRAAGKTVERHGAQASIPWHDDLY